MLHAFLLHTRVLELPHTRAAAAGGGSKEKHTQRAPERSV